MANFFDQYQHILARVFDQVVWISYVMVSINMCAFYYPNTLGKMQVGTQMNTLDYSKHNH